MSLLIVGLSHESADLALLERIGLQERPGESISARLLASVDVGEFLVLTTCNRVEVVAAVDRFHGAVNDIATALAEVSGRQEETLRGSLYVHYDDRAVHHLFSLACGLRSMALGEPQVLGQLRQALARAQDAGTVAGQLNPLLQHALRVGKRAHAETELDSVAKSLVHLGLHELAVPDLQRARVLVVGAGAMSGVAAATLARAGVAELCVVARDPAKASALAARHHGRSVPWSRLAEQLGAVDLVVTCTGATEPVIDVADLSRPRERRHDGSLPDLAILDLALPCDVDPRVGDLPGIRRCGLADLHARRLMQDDSSPVVREVEDLVTGEVAAYLTERRAHEVAPTVAALRAQAGALVQEEMARLEQRLPEMDEAARAEVRRSVSRVVDKLLHTPTVRVKEKHAQDQAEDYARVLRELFDLDPRDAVAVTTPPALGPDGVR
ncbi:MAG TPA: glutamyl-tRNA reductase [Ornithinimicrobium sp.]|uniref:glutamyl-tRNA reductase n=1 Tax=Ornithinimicrobium sp. TaxID=1977084 RepID=UPI002B46EF22|nr:glutamyl-tRNA reductase [Ornithinimicrobium sp.]HKJ12079.1 glutamyl-tRNA reductase [Ornithinimicrobium sp.]